MRLKTLGVILVTASALFVVFYWLTDAPRRSGITTAQERELLEYGEFVFSESSEPGAAGCARCHGPEGEGGPIPNDPEGRLAPSLHSASLGQKHRENAEYVRLVVSYGGVVVSGNVNSPMPAWSYEVGGPLNEQQLEAVVALVTSWAEEAATAAPSDVPNTVEAGQQIFASAGCASCHGQNLEGTTSGPNISTIGSGVVTDLGDFAVPSGLDQMVADYEADPRMFLERWIRDSAGNYNGGNATGMPSHPPETLSDNNLQALITYLLDQTGQ
jgi:mono/diheme cytochrome c family protein